MQEQWRIRIRGKQREEFDINLLVAAVIALGKQLAAEAKTDQEADNTTVPEEDDL